VQLLQVIENLNLFQNNAEARRWVDAGAIKFNGIKVNLGDDINIKEIQSIEIGKSRVFYPYKTNSNYLFEASIKAIL
jgi:hypothetical protein